MERRAPTMRGTRRAIVTAEKALLFEPAAPATRRFLDTVVPHLEMKAEQRGNSGNGSGGGGGIGLGAASQKAFANAPHTEYMARFYANSNSGESVRAPPFELEVLEGALVVATGAWVGTACVLKRENEKGFSVRGSWTAIVEV